MSFSLGRAASATSLCAVLLFSACGWQGNVAAPTAPPTNLSQAASSSASPSPSETSSTPSALPTATPSTQAVESSPATPPPLATTEQPAPSPTSAPTTIRVTAPAVVAGTDCGPSNTGRTTLVLAEGSASCAEVQETFADFNAQFAGSTEKVNINGYLCHSYMPLETRYMGRTVSCEGKGNRLEAMTDYRLGGIPIATPEPYMVTSLTGHFSIVAEAHGVSCSFGEGNHLACVRPSGGNTNQVITLDAHGNLVQNVSKENTVSNRVTDLPVGYSINTEKASCLNDGTYLVCSSGAAAFKMNASEFIEL
ncbi:MAG: hypothetical protein SPI83_02110 [Rothia sp. (in: high G+C Gram-positive bacteria)]|nr:hypothetical protein [Rothia sp. (in: high G+C Gram-positive bacteria)]